MKRPSCYTGLDRAEEPRRTTHKNRITPWLAAETAGYANREDERGVTPIPGLASQLKRHDLTDYELKVVEAILRKRTTIAAAYAIKTQQARFQCALLSACHKIGVKNRRALLAKFAHLTEANA